jgi:choline-glycine betaine transporter
MTADLPFLALLSGILGIYAGLRGRILIGVAGGVVAILALAHGGITQVQVWVALAAGIPFSMITIFLLRAAIRARKNKTA